MRSWPLAGEHFQTKPIIHVKLSAATHYSEEVEELVPDDELVVLVLLEVVRRQHLLHKLQPALFGLLTNFHMRTLRPGQSPHLPVMWTHIGWSPRKVTK